MAFSIEGLRDACLQEGLHFSQRSEHHYQIGYGSAILVDVWPGVGKFSPHPARKGVKAKQGGLSAIMETAKVARARRQYTAAPDWSEPSREGDITEARETITVAAAKRARDGSVSIEHNNSVKINARSDGGFRPFTHHLELTADFHSEEQCERSSAGLAAHFDPGVRWTSKAGPRSLFPESFPEFSVESTSVPIRFEADRPPASEAPAGKNPAPVRLTPKEHHLFRLCVERLQFHGGTLDVAIANEVNRRLSID